MSDHCDHDEDDTFTGGPIWRFSLWDVAGITLSVIGGFFQASSQGAQLMARECAAAANFSRQEKELREAEAARKAERREVAQVLDGLLQGEVEGP